MGVMLILLGASLALQTWSAGAKARARKITLVQTALALPAQQELSSLKEEVGANLARVRAGNGWCFVGLIDYTDYTYSTSTPQAARAGAPHPRRSR